MRHPYIACGMAALALAVPACSAETPVETTTTVTQTTTVAAPITTTPATVVTPSDAPVPMSVLAPGLELTRTSIDQDPTDKYPEMEMWKYAGDYRATAWYLMEQLPVGQDYDGLRWCTGPTTMAGSIDPVTNWSWGDAVELLVVNISDDSISITRGPEEGDEREACDTP